MINFDVFGKNVFSLLTCIKMFLSILQLNSVSFHLNHYFYEPANADLSLNLNRISFSK